MTYTLCAKQPLKKYKLFYRINRSEEHTSELQSRPHLVCRLLLEKKKQRTHTRGHRHAAGRAHGRDAVPPCPKMIRTTRPVSVVVVPVPAVRWRPASDPTQIDLAP